MNRRDFIKVVSVGSMSLFLSGCGLTTATDKNSDKNQVAAANTDNEKIQTKATGDKMKIVVINSSPHSETQSTSKYLSQRFTEGAKSAGHEVFTFDAANEEINPCRGCDQCGMNGPCIFKDSIENKLMPKMLEADLLVLVTPLYYFGMSAQLKTIVDRFYSRTTKLNGKKSIMMATAWNSADWTMEALINHYETLVRYMNWNDLGKVMAVGCGARSLVEKSEFGEQAYKLGANL
ncbi:MAG: flavodoxin family protein [Selenomonadaceae bacterium]|nr:flavodoxin family protein [Selenomonadaceae bacterium]